MTTEDFLYKSKRFIIGSMAELDFERLKIEEGKIKPWYRSHSEIQ